MHMRTLVIYHYFEKDLSYIDNFFHFMAFGYSPELEYIIIIAGNHTIRLPRMKNVRYIFTENKNNDFGGYCQVLKSAINTFIYDYFIFVNSSVRGPYTAAYSNACWTSYFIDKLAADAEVGLVGSTINILSAESPESLAYEKKYGGTAPFSHVQTMCYAMPQKVLLFLCKGGFFNVQENLGKSDVIRDYEIRLTQVILSGGWNIKSLLPEYNHIDYRLSHQNINPVSANGDANCNFGYFGRTVHPLEVIFIKVNRNLFSMKYLDRLTYSTYKNRRPHEEFMNNTSFIDYMLTLEDIATSSMKVDFCRQKKMIMKFIPKPLRPFSQRLFPSLAN
jgi:hypothetical protein